MGALFAGAVFGSIAWLSLRGSAVVYGGIVPFEDGPRPGKPPVVALTAGAALLGAYMAYRGATPIELLFAGLLEAVLVAIWASDVSCGIIPDWFTIGPLLLATALRAAMHQWEFLFAALLVASPFAFAAAISKGRGMGWGDVKLAALGGVVLGIYPAMWAFFVASLVAVSVAWVRHRHAEPIAFGPYLACAIGVAFATGVRT
ncbi:MAG TPA: prepilin peptidase [Candidatus Acidoferrales bacterium]|nr:prepilin peptidase [Candidatus Acidoferrales bacterium]